MRHWMILAIVALLVGPGYAQDDAPLTADTVTTETRVDAFGVEGQLAVGQVRNTSQDAYADVQIFAEVFNEDDDLIGEGIGFLVNACGEAVPFDFELQPGQSQRFAATLELFELDAEIDRVSISAQGRPTDPAPDGTPQPVPGIVPVVRDDVAMVEWVITEAAEDAEDAAPTVSLRYGIGCDRDIFTTYDWYSYDLDADTITATEHPNAALVTDPDLRERINLADDALYQRSYLRFPPNSDRRMVYQDRINTLFTAEADGSFQRIIDEELFRSTLQGYIWLPENRFMAYYFGGYGDGVTYLVASIDGAYFSTPERFSTPSVTIPGIAPDISNLVVSGTFNDDETPGFYLKPPAAERFERLFEYEPLPGNNYPAPVYRSRGGLQSEDVIYFALPDDAGGANLACYDRREGDLFTMAPLPLDGLSTANHSKMVLSPDGTQIALRATGVNGGLWVIDLTAFNVCTP